MVCSMPLPSYNNTSNRLSSDSLSGAIGWLGGSISWSIGVLVGLVRAVNGDFDSDLTTFDLLSVHLVDGLLLLLFGGESNETKATTLAGLVAGLELLDHEAWDGSKGNLG